MLKKHLQCEEIIDQMNKLKTKTKNKWMNGLKYPDSLFPNLSSSRCVILSVFQRLDKRIFGRKTIPDILRLPG